MSVPPGGHPALIDSSDRRLAGALFLTLTPLYLLFSAGHFTASDDVQKYGALRAMLRDGTVFFPEGWVSGVGGACAFHTLGGSLLMLPGTMLGWLMAPWTPVVDADLAARVFISFQNALLTAALVATLYVFGRLLGCARPATLLAALGFGLATMAFPYARTCWSEPGAALALTGALALLVHASGRGLENSRVLVAAGALFATAFLVRIELLILAPCVLAWVAWRHPGKVLRFIACVAPPLMVALALTFAYNAARFGSALYLSNWHTVQGAVQMPPGGRPVWALTNLWHYTFNPGDGPLWYSPALWLGLAGWPRLWRARPEVGQLLAFTFVPYFAFHVAAWGLSDWAWGLRYTYVLHPFVMLGACALPWSPGWRRWLGGGVLAVGLGVQLVALPHNVGYLFERERAAHPGLTIQALIADPRHAPLWLAYRDWSATMRGGFALVGEARPTEMPDLLTMRRRTQYVPDSWLVLALLTPVPRGYIFGLAVGLVGAFLLGVLRLRRCWQVTIMAMQREGHAGRGDAA